MPRKNARTTRRIGPVSLRETEELMIEIPALPRPTVAELRRDLAWIESIKCDTSPSDRVTLVLCSFVCPKGTRWINPDRYLRCVAPMQESLLGFQHWRWLVEHHEYFPELGMLLQRRPDKVTIEFPGIIALDGDGLERIPEIDDLNGPISGSWWYFGGAAPSESRVAVAQRKHIGS